VHCNGIFSADTDYHSVPHNITFPAGVTNRLINATLQNDNIFEFPENFSILISINPTPLDISVNRNTALVNISDDDRKCTNIIIVCDFGKLCQYLAITINFTQSTYVIDENDEMIQLGLMFSNPSSFDIEVDIETVGINATGELCT